MGSLRAVTLTATRWFNAPIAKMSSCFKSCAYRTSLY